MPRPLDDKPKISNRDFSYGIHSIKEKLQNGADINLMDTGKGVLQQLCLLSNDKEVFPIKDAQFLIDNGADINLQCEPERITALHWAARACRPDGVAFLLEKGAKINPINKTGETPLDMCAKEATDFSLKCSRSKQIEAKTPPPGFAQFFLGFQETKKQTAEKKRIEQSFLEHRLKERRQTIDLLKKNGGRFTSLHGPAALGDLVTMKKMYKEGADPNQFDNSLNEKKPTKFAEYNEQNEAIALLKEMGATKPFQNYFY